MAKIALNVDGKAHSIDADPDMPLLYALRDDLGLRNPKFGCGLAQCGACTVLVDGQPVRSCVTPVDSLGGAKVVTMGFSVPGTGFNMATGGWVTAAANHLKMMRELMNEGQVKSANFDFPEKYELIDHPLYDGLIEEWANKTGRQSRPNHAA